MVLDSHGCEIDESSLSTLCETDFSGTTADNLVSAAQKLGFEAQKNHCSVADLQNYLTGGVFPIVFVNLLSIEGRDITHAYVLESMTRGSVKVLDPWHGRRTIPIEQFKVAWTKTRNVVVVVHKN